MIKNICRSCNNEDLKEVISLGKSPLANNFVDKIEAENKFTPLIIAAKLDNFERSCKIIE